MVVLAHKFLCVLHIQVANVEKILKSVMSINVKDKDCNFFSLYIYLVLMDNLLFSSDAFRDKHAIINSWRNYLRICSTQIGCTDWRLYASKVLKHCILSVGFYPFLHLGYTGPFCFIQVRNKASYLLQGAVLRRSAGSASLPVQ